MPPHSLEAERAVIGAILRDHTIVPNVATLLKEDDFYSDKYQKVWQTCFELFDQAMPIDTLTLGEEMSKKGWLSDIGGADGLLEIYHETLTAANVNYYAQIVKEKSLRRKMIHRFTDIIRDAYAETGDPWEELAGAEIALQEVANGELKKPPADRVKVVEAVINDVYSRTDTKSFKGLPTGFPDVDAILLGLLPGDVTVVAGRPGSGKSALAMGIAEHVAYDLDKVVYFASAEMRETELTERLFSAAAEVDGRKMRRGDIDQEEQNRLMSVSPRLQKSTLVIDEIEEMTLTQLRGAVRREIAKRPVELVIVDYIQLLDNDEKPGASRQEVVASISRGLKKMAKKLGVHVIAVSQLNRQNVNRSDKRPQMQDLRESGQIEQDASNIVLVHRPEEYDEKDRPGEAEIIIPKVRNGKTGECVLLWQGAYTRFVNKAKHYQQEF